MKLSVVVAASNDLPSLERCLASLRREAQALEVEILVVCNFNHDTHAVLNNRFPFAKCITLSTESTVPQLRTEGIRLASGDIVALTEDYCILDPQWCAAMMKGHDHRAVAIGGAVENRAPDKLINWAVYFLDYGRYMLPAQAQFVSALCGMNVSYKRQTLLELQGIFQDGFYEASIHEELHKRGYRLYFLPSAIAYLTKDFRFSEGMGAFYHHGRSFAGKRIVHKRSVARVLFACGAPLLPVLLYGRVAHRAITKRKHVAKMIAASPFVWGLAAAWSAGELVGYLWGEGKSPSKWT